MIYLPLFNGVSSDRPQSLKPWWTNCPAFESFELRVSIANEFTGNSGLNQNSQAKPDPLNSVTYLVAIAAATCIGLVDDEAHYLALFNVVKCYNANVAMAILRAALLHFVQNFLGSSGVEQRQLPHCPIVGFSCRVFVELNTGEIAVIDRVLNLASDLSVAERRQIGEGFVPTLFG